MQRRRLKRMAYIPQPDENIWKHKKQRNMVAKMNKQVQIAVYKIPDPRKLDIESVLASFQDLTM